MRKFITLALLTLIFTSAAFSQKILNNQYETPADKFGIIGGVSFNSYKTDFIRLPDLPCCGKTFSDGSGIGFYGGILYDHPFTEILWLNLKLGYVSNAGLLKKNEAVVANLNGNAVDAIFEQSIDAGLSYIFLEPNLSFNIWKNLFFEVGVDLKFNVGKSYSQRETILEPTDGYFENGKRERLVSTGDITNVKALDFAVNAGVYYDIPLTSKNDWFLSPEVQYHYGLTDAIDKVNFQINYLTVGLGIKYSPAPKRKAEVITKEPNAKPDLNIETLAYGVGKDSVIKPVLQFHVEEFLSNQQKPLITYVFFDEDNSKIPTRYHLLKNEETPEFDENKIKNNDILEIYYDLLNIIGKRMKANPTATLTIEGCNNNLRDEKDNLDLSYQRALSVVKYFVLTWGIPEDRITLKKRNLPSEPSNNDEAEGKVENRRVEITSNMFEITAPLFVSDTLRAVDPPIVRFFNNVKSESGVKNWNLSAFQDGQMLKSFNNTDSVPPSLDWSFAHNQKSAPKSDSPIDYQLTVKNNNGEIAQTPIKSLPVDYLSISKKRRERIKDKYVDRYDLIHFGFDNSKLNPEHLKIIDIIKKDLKPSSVITVEGHTDITGNPAYNLKLSKERAKIVADAFAPNKVIFKGLGLEDPMTTNDLPEGRFYNRFVEITVETTIDE